MPTPEPAVADAIPEHEFVLPDAGVENVKPPEPFACDTVTVAANAAPVPSSETAVGLTLTLPGAAVVGAGVGVGGELGVAEAIGFAPATIGATLEVALLHPASAANAQNAIVENRLFRPI